MADRVCGDCSACCVLMGVEEIDKAPYRACPHLAGGCTIYAERPSSCRAWVCGWLTSPKLPDEMRPDRCGIVLDTRPNAITLQGHAVVCGHILVSPGHEEDYNLPLITATIRGLLQQVDVVLWQLPGNRGRLIGPGPDGTLGISDVYAAAPREGG